MPKAPTLTITDSRGRDRTINYKYRFPTLAPGKSYFAQGDEKKQRSERVLAYRWANLKGWVIRAHRTKSGKLKIARWA